MNKFIILAALLTFNSYSAEIKTCKLPEGNSISNIVVPGAQSLKSIEKALNSNKSAEEKKSLIKSLLFIESASIGDGKSFCELSVKTYKNVSDEKCMKVMRTRDTVEQILDNSDAGEISLGCKIGINAKLLMEFNM